MLIDAGVTLNRPEEAADRPAVAERVLHREQSTGQSTPISPAPTLGAE